MAVGMTWVLPSWVTMPLAWIPGEGCLERTRGDVLPAPSLPRPPVYVGSCEREGGKSVGCLQGGDRRHGAGSEQGLPGSQWCSGEPRGPGP